MRGKLGIGGTVALAAALVFACLGGYFLVAAGRYSAMVRREQARRPVDLAVDLSRPGEHTARFRQTFAGSHHEAIGLLLPEGLPEGKDPGETLAGLSAWYRITAADGETVVEAALDPGRAGRGASTFLCLDYFTPFAVGEYVLRVEVLAGAPALGGVRQRLQLRYLMCGLEMMPAAILLIAGIVVLVLGAAAGLVAFVTARRRRRAGRPGISFKAGPSPPETYTGDP